MHALFWLSALHAGLAVAGTASFDNLNEGVTRRSITEDGVTLTDLDNLVDPPPGVMVPEQADGNLTGMPGFSPRMVLGFGGYVPGSGVAFGQLGALTIHGTGPTNFGRVEVFHLGNGGETLRLEAWSGGSRVGSDSVVLTSWGGVTHDALEVSGVVFDTLKLVGGRPGHPAAVFACLDDVTVTWVGAPPGGDTGLGADTDASDTDRTVTDTDPTPADTDPTPADTDRPVADTLADGGTTTDTDGAAADARASIFLEKRCGCASGEPASWAPLLWGVLAVRRRRADRSRA